MQSLKIIKSITDRKTDSIDKYLKDVSREQMINCEMEVELAKKIKEGDKKALEKLIKANLRFVISVAKQYQNYGLSLPDLICEGNIGLIKAAKRFDETKGFKFISYAVWWIRQAILEAISANSNMIRLPQNRFELLRKIKKSASMLEQKLNREPTMSEIAEDLDEPVAKIINILYVNGRKMSFDEPVLDDSDAKFSDLYPGDENSHSDKYVMEESLRKDIALALKPLSIREQEIIRCYFGLNGEEMDLKQLSERFGLSSERLRQIKDRALFFLRRSKTNKRLIKYLAS